jgi:hypothetical protein
MDNMALDLQILGLWTLTADHCFGSVRVQQRGSHDFHSLGLMYLLGDFKERVPSSSLGTFEEIFDRTLTDRRDRRQNHQ